MIEVRIEVRWGEQNLETGRPINGSYSDLVFSDEDMAGDQIQVWEALKLTWAAVRSRYMHATRGPKWYMKDLKKKAENMGQVWHG